MKCLMVVLALMPLIHGQMPASFSGQLRESIEDFKQRMPCGFPKYGLPSLAPYTTEHQEIATDNDIIQAFGEINDFRLDGLNDFDIVLLRVNALLSRINFKFNWNKVQFTTDYNLTSARGGKGMRRHGPAQFEVKDFTVWGLIKYNLGILSGKLSLKELSVYVSLREVNSEIEGLSRIRFVNRKLNRIIEEWIMLAVNDNTKKVSEITNGLVMPFVNDFLSDKTVSDLLAMAGSKTEESEPCIPPEVLD